ncbi:MAG: hypothetical protein PUC00_03095 [Clostridiales bacterium]|nr:hypothetical protein [Clostridiales bacterium]
MLWLWLLLMMGYTLLLDIRIQADLRHGDGTHARLRLYLGAIHRTWHLTRPARSAQILLAREDGAQVLSPGGIPVQRGWMVLKALHRADRARRFLLHHIHLERLDAQLTIHTSDADRTALVTGALRGVVAQLPSRWHKRVRIRVLPEFLQTFSTVQARCIIRLRLGTILLTAMLLLLAYLLERRQTESEEA